MERSQSLNGDYKKPTRAKDDKASAKEDLGRCCGKGPETQMADVITKQTNF